MHDPAIERLRGLLPPDEWDYYHGLLSSASRRGEAAEAGETWSGSTTSGMGTWNIEVPHVGASSQLSGMEILGMLSLSNVRDVSGRQVFPNYADVVLNHMLGNINIHPRTQARAARINANRRVQDMGTAHQMFRPPYQPIQARGRWFQYDDTNPLSEIVLEMRSSYSDEEFGEEYSDDQISAKYPALEIHEFLHRAFSFFTDHPEELFDDERNEIMYHNPVTGQDESVIRAIMEETSDGSNIWKMRRDVLEGDDMWSSAQRYPGHELSRSIDWRRGYPIPVTTENTLEHNRKRRLLNALNGIANNIIERSLERTEELESVNRMRGRTASGM